MATIVRPSLKASFAKHAKGPFPGDLLDVQIQNLIEAIHSTQEALADIRRDDGKLKHNAIGPDQLAAVVRHGRGEIDQIEQKILETGRSVANTATQFAQAAREIDLRAKDAEIAAFSAQAAISHADKAGIEARDALDDAENAADQAQAAAIASQNSANYATAQADNAIAANVEAAQWAEYLAGPVVNSAEAPAYIAGHPFGHGLYYQPVEGYGGVAGLWSAKWWAVYAAQLVGSWNFYYLGSWPYPPVPGSTNPATGVKVPNPLAPGSFYYNTDSNQLHVWDGTQWQLPFAEVLSPGIASSYVYIATVGQTVFSGVDAYGHIPVVGLSPSDVYVDGLRQVYGADYTVNATTSTLTLVTPAPAGAFVQWDLLAGTDPTVGVTIRKVVIAPAPDGINTAFTMTWINPGVGSEPVDIQGGPQLQLSLDGIIQEPGTDYVASGASLTMGTAPQLNSRFWALWFAAGVAPLPPPDEAPVNTVLPVIAGSSVVGSILSATTGTWTGYPTPLYAYQWKSAGANVGANSNIYATVAGDVGKTITVTVTATNSTAAVPATSAAFGPIAAIDTTPDAFSFTDAGGAALSTVVESNAITVAGINAPATMTVTGGEYSKNAAAYASTSTTVNVGDTVKVRGTSSSSNSTAVNVTLTIGGVSDTFTITTLAGASTFKPTYLIYFV